MKTSRLKKATREKFAGVPVTPPKPETLIMITTGCSRQEAKAIVSAKRNEHTR